MRWFCLSCGQYHFTEEEIENCPERKKMAAFVQNMTVDDWRYCMKVCGIKIEENL